MKDEGWGMQHKKWHIVRHSIVSDERLSSFIPHPSSFGLLLNRREDHWRVVRNTDGEAGVVREAREAFYTGKIKPQSGSSYLHA